MNKYFHWLWVPLCWMALPLQAQDQLSLEDAVATALKNNHDILLAQNNTEQAKNNQSVLNSGFLPNATATGNANYTNTNTTFTTQMGQETSINGAEIQSVNAEFGINYILYNGGARKYSYERLKSQYQLANVQKRQQIETTLIDVYTQYFVIARTQEQLKTLTENYSISKERLERVKAQKSFGQKTQLDVLNAQVDANADSINLMTIGVELSNAKKNLNFLLGRAVNTPFTVMNEVNYDASLSKEKLKNAMDSNNVQLKQIQINRQMAAFDLRVNKSGWLPTLSTSASYRINYSDNGQVGFFQNQQSAGFNAGLNLTWNLFDGGGTHTRTQNAEIALKSRELDEQRLRLNLENQLELFWAEYNTQKAVVSNEQLNLQISQANFDKSKEKYQLGQITSLEFRQAQLSLAQTELNLLNAKYAAKLAELRLKQFAGLLI